MDTDNRDRAPARTEGLDAAARLMEEVDGCRNLHPSVPVFLFLAAGGVAVRSFFWGIDVATWLGFDRVDPVLPASISFVTMFVVWILAYLSGMTLLDRMKFRDVRLIARNRLERLALSGEELRVLRRRIGAGGNRHANTLNEVISRLEAAAP